MGGAASLFGKSGGEGTETNTDAGTDATVEKADLRRRNSFAFYLTRFLKHEEEDFTELIEIVKADREVLLRKAVTNVREQKMAKIAETVAQGSMRECRRQVVSAFKAIQRKYKDCWLGNTLLHIACQEGYPTMVNLILDPKNHSVFDDIELDLNILNDRRRSPLLLCFTPPTATYLGLRNGISEECMPIPSKPEDIEIPSDWIKPGGPRQREMCISLLISYGANVNIRDYHDYTPLHYACMWGWPSTVKMLIEAGANLNDTNFQGRTALMLAIEFGNDSVVEMLLRLPGVFANGVDADGNSCLILAAEHGENGNEMCRMLLRCGADPNTENRKGKSPLQLACQLQNLQLVFDLLDNKVQRKGEAFALLDKEKMVILHKRLQEEERQAAIEAARLEKERAERAEDGGVDMAYSGYKKRSPWGCWVQFNDKRGRGIFYYNYVSRQSQWEEPPDFQKKKDALIKDATYGMSFYH